MLGVGLVVVLASEDPQRSYERHLEQERQWQQQHEEHWERQERQQEEQFRWTVEQREGAGHDTGQAEDEGETE